MDSENEIRRKLSVLETDHIVHGTRNITKIECLLDVLGPDSEANMFMKKADVIKAFDEALNEVLSSDILKTELAEKFLYKTGLFDYARDLFENEDTKEADKIVDIISALNCEDV